MIDTEMYFLIGGAGVALFGGAILTGGRAGKIIGLAVAGLVVAGGTTGGVLYATGFFDDETELVGEWYVEEGLVLEMKENGSIEYKDMEMPVTLRWFDDDGDSFKIEMIQDGEGDIQTIKYKISNNVLFIQNPNDSDNGECDAWVRSSVADSEEEWEDAIDDANVPSWCDSIDGYGSSSSNGPSFYTLTVADHTAEIEDDNAAVLSASFGGGDALNWDLIEIELIEDSNTVRCDNPGHQNIGLCSVSIPSEYDLTDLWEKGETIIVTEGSHEFCASAGDGEGCVVTFRVSLDADTIMQAQVNIN